MNKSEGLEKKRSSQRPSSKNKKAQSQNRIATFVVIGIAALIILGILIIPNMLPVGDIKSPATEIKRSLVKANTMGDPNAPVKLVEYADFQCPACGRFAAVAEPIIVEKYINTGKVFYTFVPFSFIDGNTPNGESKKAAQAAYCASEQSKFWEMHDLIFANQNGENQGDFADRRLKAFASKISLDTGAFNSCLDSGKYAAQVADDLKQGEAKGVSSTPSFVINGKLIQYQSYDDIYKAIDNAIAGK
jgi:protein-disulfide isomerase